MAMTSSELALRFDSLEQPLEAAWAYEVAIQEPSARIELFLNLAVLYFEFNDFGYAAFHKLSEDVVGAAWDRGIAVLDLAESRHGPDTEVVFWREYFAYIYRDNPRMDIVLRELAKQGSPIAAAFSKASSGPTLHDKLEELRAHVKEGRTERERYLRGILK